MSKAQSNKTEPDTKTTVYIEPDLYRKAKSIMALNDDSLKDLVNEKLRDYVNKHK